MCSALSWRFYGSHTRCPVIVPRSSTASRTSLPEPIRIGVRCISPLTRLTRSPSCYLERRYGGIYHAEVYPETLGATGRSPVESFCGKSRPSDILSQAPVPMRSGWAYCHPIPDCVGIWSGSMCFKIWNVEARIGKHTTHWQHAANFSE